MVTIERKLVSKKYGNTILSGKKMKVSLIVKGTLYVILALFIIFSVFSIFVTKSQDTRVNFNAQTVNLASIPNGKPYDNSIDDGIARLDLEDDDDEEGDDVTISFDDDDDSDKDEPINETKTSIGDEIIPKFPILPKKLVTVVGLESSGTTFTSSVLKTALGQKNYRDGSSQFKKLNGEDSDVQVHHFSLPWGGSCVNHKEVPFVKVVLPAQCSRPYGDNSTHLEQCNEMIQDAYGFQTNGQPFKYPRRYNLDLVSHMDWYEKQGVEHWLVIMVRDLHISGMARSKVHCTKEPRRLREEEAGTTTISDAINKYVLKEGEPMVNSDNFWIWKAQNTNSGGRRLMSTGIPGGNRVVLASYESMVHLGEPYFKMLYQALEIESDYIPNSVKNGNKKYVREKEVEAQDVSKIEEPVTPELPAPIEKSSKVNIEGAALATLISNSTGDVFYMRRALSSVDQYLQDDLSAPLLIFNEGNLSDEQKSLIQSCSTREIKFPEVSFDDFPDGFDPVSEEPNWHKRSKWGYQQMCRFWMTRIWDHPALDGFTSFMRVDADACYQSDMESFLPGLVEDDTSYVYIANKFNRENKDYSEGLIEFTKQYIEDNNIEVKNPNLWGELVKRHKNGKQLKIIYNNFEVSKISFFRQPHVMAFQKAVSEGEPFGVFRKRWGDAPVRTITLALFADAKEVRWYSQPKRYSHPCRRQYAEVGTCLVPKDQLISDDDKEVEEKKEE